MFERTLIALSCAILPACLSTSKPKPVSACEDVVKAWAAGAQVHAQPQADGGVLFIRPKLTHLEFFVLVAEINAGKALQEITEGQKMGRFGKQVQTGSCRHPANGYVYTTLEFTYIPEKQKAENTL